MNGKAVALALAVAGAAELVGAAMLASQTASDRVDDVIALTRVPTGSLLAETLADHPDAGRQALRRLLREATPTGTASGRSQRRGAEALSGLQPAERLARAYFEAWNDPFPLRRVARFRDWTPAERREWTLIDSLRLAGNDAWVERGVDPAMRLWEESARRAERLGDTVSAARALGNIAAGLVERGQTERARATLDRAYALASTTGDLLTAANALTVSANLDYQAGDLALAVEHYGRSLDLLERTGSYRSAAANRHNLGLVALAAGDLATARTSLTEAVRTARLHGYAGDEAESLSSLADIERATGQLASADTLLRRALALAASSGNRLAEAGTQLALGTTAMAGGRYRDAQSHLRAAGDLFDKLGRSDLAVDARLELSRALGAAGELGAAIAVLDTALALAADTDLESLLRARLMLAAGDLRLSLNLYPEARQAFREARELFAAGGRPLGEAAALQGEALVLLARDDFEEALQLLGRAASRNAAAGAEREAAVMRMQLAWAHDRLGHPDVARAVLRGVVDDLEAADDGVATALALTIAGDIALRAADAELAASSFERGLALVDESDAPDVAWRLRAGLGGANRLRGDVPRAIEQLERAVAIIERPVATIGRPGTASAWLSNKWSVFGDLALAHLAAGEVEAAFLASERWRARRTLALLEHGRVRTGQARSATWSRREQDARWRLTALRGGSDGYMADRPGAMGLRERDAGPLPEESRIDLLRAAETAYTSVLESERSGNDGTAALLRPTSIGPADVARLLASDEVFIEYLLTDSVVIAFAVTTDTSIAQRLPIDPDALGDLVRFARGTVEREARSGDEGLWRAPLARLYDILLEPLSASGVLGERTHLYVAPHAELHYLPFGALIRRGSPDDRFLVEDIAVSTVPSAAAWQAVRQRGERRAVAAPGRVLALAPRPEELPGSRREVHGIAGRLSSKVELLEGAAATHRALLERTPGADVIHVASFGVLNPLNPLYSYVELSGDGGAIDRLEVHEIFGLDLDAWLVVLSACQTGLGRGKRSDVPAGDDWIGLQNAFLAAGARAVVASLWRVADLATADLMESMYDGLAHGEPVADALAEAQRSMIRKGASPFVWAAFTVVGHGGAAP